MKLPVAAAVAVAFGAGVVAGPILLESGMRAHAQDGGRAETFRLLNLFGDVFERVRGEYVEPVTDRDLIENAIGGMLTGLDPHSAYLDGSDLQVVKTFTDDFPQHARWSPDGQRVAFFSNKGGDSRDGAGIRVIHTDGSNERHVGAGNLGSMAWHATRHELTFCPQNFASISMLGNDGVGVFGGYTMAVNTDTGAVTARPQVDPAPPVFVVGSGRDSVKCWMPLWVGDTLLVNREVTEMTQGRLLSAPGVVPARYEIAQRFLPITVTQHLVSGGTYNAGVPNTLAWGPAYLLDVNPVTLEVMV